MIEVALRFSLFCVLRVLDDYGGLPVPGVSVMPERGVAKPIGKPDGIFAFAEAHSDTFTVRVTAACYEPRELTLTRGSVGTIRLRATDKLPLPSGACGVSGVGRPDGIAALSPMMRTHRLYPRSADSGSRLLGVDGMPAAELLGASMYIYDAAENRGEFCEITDITDGGYLLKNPLKQGYEPERTRVYRLHTAYCGASGDFYLPVPAAEKAFFWLDMDADEPPQLIDLKPGRVRIQ